MHFIDSLGLNAKLWLLLSLIGIGLGLVAMIGYINISTMKKNLDTLYFGSLVPVIELNKILHQYHNGIETTFFELRHDVISPPEGAQRMQYALNQIAQQWEAYASHYKRTEEMEYLTYTHSEIIRISHFIEKVIAACAGGCDSTQLPISTMAYNVESIENTVTKLINYEIDSAKYERRMLLVTYERTIWQLSVLIAVIVAGVMFLAWAIFLSIKKQQNRLEQSSRKLHTLNQQLQNATMTDSLTGLHNRRFFNIVYERELKRSKRIGVALGFIMIDIDYFKQYNDTYGHLEGDRTLQRVAAILQQTLKRPGDYVFRLGGEEFGAIVSDTDALNTRLISEKIRENVEAAQIIHSASLASEHLSVSVGAISTVITPEENEEYLIRAADKNLYAAKEAGRNRCVVS